MFEFRSTIENGVIPLPQEYRAIADGTVRVIVLPEGQEESTEQFTALKLDTKGFRFDREYANDR